MSQKCCNHGIKVGESCGRCSTIGKASGEVKDYIQHLEAALIFYATQDHMASMGEMQDEDGNVMSGLMVEDGSHAREAMGLPEPDDGECSCPNCKSQRDSSGFGSGTPVGEC